MIGVVRVRLRSHIVRGQVESTMLVAATARQTAARLSRPSFASRLYATRISSSAAGEATDLLRRVAAATAFLVSGTLFAVYYFDSRSAIHRYFFTPALRYGLDAETSHRVAVKVLRSGLAPRDMGVDDERLSVEVRT